MSDPEIQRPVASTGTQILRLIDAVGAPLTELGRRYARWADDNQETIQRFLAGVVAFKVWVIDDITAEDGAELRAVVFDVEILRTVIRHGWYPTANMSAGQVADLAGELEDPDEERAASAHEVFINKFREDADTIEQRLATQFPDRAQAISDAFAAHRQAKFSLSIPVFLAQADGITSDRLGETLFSSKTIQMAEGLASEVKEGILRKLFLGLMWSEWPLALPVNQRPDNFSGLNRHQVMHGEVSDYGTEVNSLQAMALLNFCSFILTAQPVPMAPAGAEPPGGPHGSAF